MSFDGLQLFAPLPPWLRYPHVPAGRRFAPDPFHPSYVWFVCSDGELCYVGSGAWARSTTRPGSCVCATRSASPCGWTCSSIPPYHDPRPSLRGPARATQHAPPPRPAPREHVVGGEQRGLQWNLGDDGGWKYRFKPYYAWERETPKRLAVWADLLLNPTL